MSVAAILLPFGFMGVVVGVLLAVLAKRKKPSSAPAVRDVESLSAEQLHRLAQLKSQLESGLITNEEYYARRQEILREL
jgi:hypothetical protein